MHYNGLDCERLTKACKDLGVPSAAAAYNNQLQVTRFWSEISNIITKNGTTVLISCSILEVILKPVAMWDLLLAKEYYITKTTEFNATTRGNTAIIN